MSTLRRRRIPIWDATRSDISQPVLLYEGESCRFVDYSDVSESHTAGKEIVVRWLQPQTVKTIDWLKPQFPVQKDLRRVQKKRTVKVAKRVSEALDFAGGFSARLPAGRAGNGITESFASGHERTRRIVGARKTARWRGRNSGVPQAVLMATTERAILFMPNTGGRTGVSSKSSGLTFVRRTTEGWEAKDATGWTLVTETEAREMVKNGSGILGPAQDFENLKMAQGTNRPVQP